MKCNHCNGEHPDGFKFCPVTGKEIQQSFKACTNQECVDFNKHILPPDALFCPRCGWKIINGQGNSHQYESQNRTTVHDTDALFPLHGVILGKTSVNEMRRQNVEYDEDDNSITIAEATFVTYPNDDVFMAVEVVDMIPHMWRHTGLEFGVGTTCIRGFIKDYNLILTHENKEEISAISRDCKYSFYFCTRENIFDYMSIECLRKNNNLCKIGHNSTIDKFFPIANILLGKMTPSNLKESGYPIRFLESGTAVIKRDKSELMFMQGGLGVYDSVHITYTPPYEWEALGFKPNLSYGEYMTLLAQLDFQVQTYNNKICAISHDKSIALVVIFNKDGELLRMLAASGIWAIRGIF